MRRFDHRRWGAACIWLCLTQAAPVRAVEAEGPLISARELGRGRTGIAGHRDDPGSLANSATLAAAGAGLEIRYLQADIAYNDRGKRTVRKINKLTSKDSLNFVEEFVDRLGEEQFVAATVYPVGVRYGPIDITPYTTTRSEFLIRDPSLTRVRVLGEAQAGVRAAYGRAMLPNLDLGLATRLHHQWYRGGDMSFADALAGLGGKKKNLNALLDKREGNALALDLGVIYRPLDTLRLGATLNDFGDTSTFTGGEAPPPAKQELSVGAMNRCEIAPNWYWDAYTDTRDLFNRGDRSLLRRTHFGTEVGYGTGVAGLQHGLMLGVNDGYTSVGAYASLWIVSLAATRYSAELGATPGQIRDPRTSLELRIADTY